MPIAGKVRISIQLPARPAQAGYQDASAAPNCLPTTGRQQPRVKPLKKNSGDTLGDSCLYDLIRGKIKLYSLPLSPFAARVRGAIYAKNLPIEIVAPPEGWRTSAEFQTLNPLKRIPVLVLDDSSGLAESGVIGEYLEDKFPTPSLRPQSPEACARMRVIIQIADIYVMQAMLPLFHLFDAKEWDMAAIEQQIGKLDNRLMRMNDLMTDNSYAHAGRLSTADVWLTPIRFTIDGLMGFSGRTALLDRYKRLSAYREVINGDPALERVWHEMEEGLKGFMAARTEAAKANQPA